MLNMFRHGLLAVALAAVGPVVWQATAIGGWRDCCCRVCTNPCGQCSCAPAAAIPVPQTTYQPVVETQYAQQPVWQQRDVVSTEYRNEAVNESVPATVYENVMVDEGGYQTVWVPKMTTKSVAKTVYQTRTSYRSVPYQVTRRVSECALTSVPYQTVRYVPSSSLAVTSPTTGTAISSLPYNLSPTASPIARSAPTATPTIASSGSSSAGPVPDPKFANAPTTAIVPRSTSITARSDSSRTSVTSTTAEHRTADRGPSMFAPAPSAAQVWRTPRNTTMR